jgi:hypothetical protein
MCTARLHMGNGKGIRTGRVPCQAPPSSPRHLHHASRRLDACHCWCTVNVARESSVYIGAEAGACKQVIYLVVSGMTTGAVATGQTVMSVHCDCHPAHGTELNATVIQLQIEGNDGQDG